MLINYLFNSFNYLFIYLLSFTQFLGVESFRNHYESFTPKVLKRLLEEENDMDVTKKKFKKNHIFDDDDDEVDELMEPETSTDYEEEGTYDSDSEVSDNSI